MLLQWCSQNITGFCNNEYLGSSLHGLKPFIVEEDPNNAIRWALSEMILEAYRLHWRFQECQKWGYPVLK